LTELADVLGREKLDPYVTHDEREEFFEALVARAVIIEPTEPVRAALMRVLVSKTRRCSAFGMEDLVENLRCETPFLCLPAQLAHNVLEATPALPDSCELDGEQCIEFPALLFGGRLVGTRRLVTDTDGESASGHGDFAM
jgi:hypothetical protein